MQPARHMASQVGMLLPLQGHPGIDEAGTVAQLDARRLETHEEPDHGYVDQRDMFQVEDDVRPGVLELYLQLFQTLCLDSPTQLQERVVPVGALITPERHGRASSKLRATLLYW